MKHLFTIMKKVVNLTILCEIENEFNDNIVDLSIRARRDPKSILSHALKLSFTLTP